MSSINKYHFIALIEGCSVMAIELAGAKIIGSFYGTTLYAMTAVLAVTLAGLTGGYWIGGWATQRFSPDRLLFGVLLITSLLIALMPGLGLAVVPATQDMGIRTGALLSAFVVLFLPLLAIGMSSPALIQLSTTDVSTSGKSAGIIYGISTLGGILSAITMGFYFLPDWGVRKSLFLVSGLLLFACIPMVLQQKKLKTWMISGAMLTGFIFMASAKSFTDPKMGLKFLYRSEGILGQVSVLDNPHPETNRVFRLLMINQIPQTHDNVAILPVSGWSYPHRLATLAAIKPAGSKALMIGMGGGNIAMELKKMGFKTDVVEIDERMPKVAEKYFGFDPAGSNISIDDGRHFIKTNNGQYDLVIIDVLNGESQPYHLFTAEAFAELKKILSKDALVLINFQGYFFGEHGRAARSIYKTLQSSGFDLQYFFSGDQQTDGDLHFIASMSDINYQNLDESRLNECCSVIPHTFQDLVSSKPVDLTDAVVFTDDKPQLELMNTNSTENWRKRTIETYLINLPTYKIPYFN